MRTITKNILVIVPLLIFASSCNKIIPVRYGNFIDVHKSSQTSKGIAIHWFGTSNHYINLDELAIITDPFVSYQSMFRILLSGHIKSEQAIVDKFYSNFKTH